MRKMVRGEGRAGCVFYTVLALMVGFFALRVVPHQVAKLQLKDYMKELAMTAARQDANWFKRQIKERCDDLDIPIEAKNIQIKKSQKRIVMDVSYTVVIDLVVTESEPVQHFALLEALHHTFSLQTHFGTHVVCH